MQGCRKCSSLVSAYYSPVVPNDFIVQIPKNTCDICHVLISWHVLLIVLNAVHVIVPKTRTKLCQGYRCIIVCVTQQLRRFVSRSLSQVPLRRNNENDRSANGSCSQQHASSSQQFAESTLVLLPECTLCF
eukprot:TRINITY_DN9920_c1_g1_i2.p1 TRINITY_DN9920_c1_g1~~TRINITY_DN9920_c1_g1_i2.p1  ORF type:complete len:131 (-),score=16.19 TRINITY_DN9920_c1_g1_i2:302-694(-)